MKRIFAFLFAFTVIAASAADKFDVQDVRKTFVGDCSMRGISKGDDPQKVTSFCACSFDVMATNMTVAEYLDMDRAVKEKRSPDQLSQLVRIRSKVEQCKAH